VSEFEAVCILSVVGTSPLAILGFGRVAWALTDASFRGRFLPWLAGAVIVSVALGLLDRRSGTLGMIVGALVIAMALGTLYAAASEWRRGEAWWANWDPVVPAARGGGARNRWAFVVLVGIVAGPHAVLRSI
jgi:hypothetical protein